MKRVKIVAAVLTVLCVLFVSACVTYTSFEELTTNSHEDSTAYEYNTTVYYQEQTTAEIVTEAATAVQTTAPEATTVVNIVPETQPQTETTVPFVPVEQTTAAGKPSDVSAYSKKQIIDTYADALNKTRNYSDALTVNHTESFTADIKDAHPGGALTELLASNIVKLVGSEGQQTLNFKGGYAVNADGESVPILLPQRAAFSLPEQGVASAEITKSGDKTKIKLVLVSETVSMGQVPTYNAGAIGYLDTSDMSFKIVTISRVDITYPGSVIEAVINGDGYIESVKYTINMSTYAELSGMGISGYGTLEGAQTESWELVW